MKKLLVVTSLGLVTLLSSLAAEDCIKVPSLNVEFKNDSTTYINNMEDQKVEKFAKFIKKHNLYALVEGHTNSLAPAVYNHELSTQRAIKVRAQLVTLGLKKDQIRAMGFGESSPLYDNTTDEGLLKNRRVLAEVFDNAKDLDQYIQSEKSRIKETKFKEL